MVIVKKFVVSDRSDIEESHKQKDHCLLTLVKNVCEKISSGWAAGGKMTIPLAPVLGLSHKQTVIDTIFRSSVPVHISLPEHLRVGLGVKSGGASYIGTWKGRKVKQTL